LDATELAEDSATASRSRLTGGLLGSLSQIGADLNIGFDPVILLPARLASVMVQFESAKILNGEADFSLCSK
jgi:hypothetical protein